MSLGDKKGQWASWRMMFPPIKDLFNAGLFLPVRKQFSKRGSAQLQGHAWFILAQVKIEEWYDNCGLFF